MMQKKEVYCDVCGKYMGMGYQGGVYTHMACAEKAAENILHKIQTEKNERMAKQTVVCPEYLEPKHRCRIK